MKEISRYEAFPIGKAILLFFFIIFGFYLHLYLYSQNYPLHDDYTAILRILVMFEDEHSLFFENFFAAHNEHMILFSKSLALIIYFIFGEMNFQAMQWFGACGLLIIFFIITRNDLLESFKEKRSSIYLIILLLALWFFRPQNYKMLFYAMASIQSIGVVTLASLYFYMVMQGRRKYIYFTSPLLLILGVLINTNAILLGFIAGFYLLVEPSQGLKHSKNRFFLVGLQFFTAIFILILDKLLIEKNVDVSFPINNLDVVIEFFLRLMGASIGTSVFNQEGIILAFGIFILILSLYYLFFVEDENKLIKPLIIFCAASIGMIAVARSELYAEHLIAMSTDGRYVIYSLLLSGLLLYRLALKHVSSVNPSAVLQAVAIVCLLSVSAYFYQIRHLQHIQHVLEGRCQDWKVWQRGGIPEGELNNSFKIIMDKSLHNKVFSVDDKCD